MVRRLLTPGIATPLIIEIFIRLIKIMKFIDPSSYILEVVSTPIKKYLSERKDTIRCMINTIFMCDDDTSIKEDLSKQYLRSNKSKLVYDQLNDYDFISSDEDEAAAEAWEPLPLEKKQDFTSIAATKNKLSDIVSTLVNIFGSPEKFIEQYKRMLAERSVSDNNFSLENEIKNLELLKLKFGEQALHNCEVVMKDVKDSIKINTTIKHLLNQDNRNFNFNCLIINKNYWPFDDQPKFNLDNTEHKLDSFDAFINNFKSIVSRHKSTYSSIKFSRTLNLLSHIGFVNLSLTFDNGTFHFRVSTLAAVIIHLFDENNAENYHLFTVDFISDKLNTTINDVKRKLNFWLNKGVLIEQIPDDKLDDTQAYFVPAQILKNVDSSDGIIIEEDIYNFEYKPENENTLNLENAINSITKNSGPRTFEQLYKNLVLSYQVNISELKLKDILGKMILEQKIFKEGEVYKLIVTTN